MRCCLALLPLFFVLPAMSVLAAPVPDPSAILDIGPPPKEETAEQYRKRMIEAQTGRCGLCSWYSDPELRKLPSVSRFKDARPWLAKNLRVTVVKGDRLLRFTFQAGTRTEQVAILNALLRDNLAVAEHAINRGEKWMRKCEQMIEEDEARIKIIKNPQEVAKLRKGIENTRTHYIVESRADIARWKQMVVIKWAK